MFHINHHDLPFHGERIGVKYVMQGPRIEWGILRLEPGMSSKDYGLHYHTVVEETFIFLEGAPLVEIDGVAVRVKEGDAIRVDPGERHCLTNDTAQPVIAIFIKAPYLPEDRVLEEP